MADVAGFSLTLHRSGRRLSVTLDCASTIRSGTVAGEWDSESGASAFRRRKADPKEAARVAAVAKAFQRLLRNLNFDLSTCASPKAGTPGAQFCSPDDRCPECELREALR